MANPNHGAAVMRSRLLIGLGLAYLLTGAIAVGAEGPEQVDLLIRGGTVVPMDDKGTVLEHGAVAVRGDRIVAVGTDADLAAKYQAKRTIDAAGKVIMPGLDQHAHARADGADARHRRRSAADGLAE